MTAWRAFKVLLILGLIAGGGYAFWRWRGHQEVAEESLGVVERGDLVVKVTISGGIVPKRHALITPSYSGYVQKVFVKIGDRVREGAPIVSIAQAVGAVQEDVFPLRSPLNGIVVQVWRKEGEYVNATPGGSSPDATLVRIDDTSKLYVEASIPEVEIDKLRTGLPVVIRAVAVPQRTYKGRINEIALASKEAQGNLDRVRVEFPMTVEILEQDELLRPGMSVVIDVIVKQAKQVLKLRHEYVQRGPKGYFVTTAKGEKKPVEVGLENEDAFEIKSGVSEGEQVKQVDFLASGNGGMP